VFLPNINKETKRELASITNEVKHVISFIFVGLAMLGYLYYGWLLFQTVMSGASFEVTVEFAIRFLLWLFPIVGLPILIIVERFQTKRKQN